MRRRRKAEEAGTAVQIELIEPRSTHRRFVPKVAAYEVVQRSDGQFRVLERPQSAVTTRVKERKEPSMPSRAVQAVHRQRATWVKHPTLEALERTKTVPGGRWVSDERESGRKVEIIATALEAALVMWRDAAVQDIKDTCSSTTRQTTARVLKLMQCAAVVRQRSVDVVNTITAWRTIAGDTSKEFRWQGRNYLVHMANDLDVLESEAMLAHALGIPSFKHNPLLCAITLSDPQWQRYRADPSPARLAQLQATMQLTNEVDGDMLLSFLTTMVVSDWMVTATLQC
ncbi:hypothetical protein H310_03882 [Aphanomyces invadans]|uniref:Uncharacterized protein n=1 Tax=Aphanomyces invadans TaxID=157072 RepID=A0A024UGG2_9STRA|nr:hypothetical protein H310_03882 [Aphanomyces invadans]ETW04733.1 hypothetical protein H310_03882 [Aphanomyces invadans]|eukprot:XP_008866171.1 hypothetical protein H310_03882 [Aphanomyces invadans]